MRLLIVGPGEVSNILSLAENFGLKDNVIYLSVKNDKVEPAQIISAGDVGIVPYDDNLLWKDHVPAKFYEYCACSIPVIATVYDDSLLASIIKKHEVGLATPPMDDEKLSKAILWFYRNAQLREVMGRRARMLIKEEFDRNKIADEFLKLVEECVSNG
jgi:glycosyltransferase involved in cell wall biosynthesis